ncbi:uncharacterized protein LOC142985485 [Anticarsia gemmatalis]|uniref:uncharacterized protein LOC142985485 n=1 Tax=Anticarsia gemmatalis TaxID=129554 RepID=UPI003F75C41E
MYLLFWTLCYITILLNPATSYVLLAANVEDFRSIADKFAPKKMAHDLMKFVKPKEHTNQDSISDVSKSTETRDAAKSRKSQKKESDSKYELTLNYLVETVKQRLKDELKLAMESQPEEDKTFLESEMEREETIKTQEKKRPERISRDYKHGPGPTTPQARYKKISRNDTEIGKDIGRDKNRDVVKPKRKKPVQDDRYIADVFVAPPPKLLTTKEPRPIIKSTTKHVEKHKKLSKEKIRKERKISHELVKITKSDMSSEIREGDVKNLFQGIDMTNTNDSYEDYVTPKKDDDYYEKEPKHKYKEKTERLSAKLLHKNEKNLSTDSDDSSHRHLGRNKQKQYKIEKENERSDLETINYNKKRKKDRSLEQMNKDYKNKYDSGEVLKNYHKKDESNEKYIKKYNNYKHSDEIKNIRQPDKTKYKKESYEMKHQREPHEIRNMKQSDEIGNNNRQSHETKNHRQSDEIGNNNRQSHEIKNHKQSDEMKNNRQSGEIKKKRPHIIKNHRESYELNSKKDSGERKYKIESREIEKEFDDNKKYGKHEMVRTNEPSKKPPFFTPEDTNDTPIQPYADQILGVDDDGEQPLNTASDELKARTESLNFDENYVPKLKEDLPYSMSAKSSRKPKSFTVIPKRDFYKMSSPDYLGKLPIVAEKYKFDEPIPEEDQEHENLKPFKNPSASINGRVVLL